MSQARKRKGDEVPPCRKPAPEDEIRKFITFLWNPQTKTVLGRSGTSWAKIGLFYVVFYLFLAAYFSVMMIIFYQTLNDDEPKYTGTNSSLTNPGLGFRPRTDNEDDLRPTITYNPLDPESFASYVASMEKHWDLYKTRHPSATDCLPGDGYREEGDQVCFFDVKALNTTCSPDNLWGYNTTSPCILLKLNKMFHWRPEPLVSLDTLPEGLRQHIINASNTTSELLEQNVWVWCESEDVEMEQPSPSLPISYFPYRKQEGYVAPFAPVRLRNLTVGEKVEVRCRGWARNVKHSINSRKLGEVKLYVEMI